MVVHITIERERGGGVKGGGGRRRRGKRGGGGGSSSRGSLPSPIPWAHNNTYSDLIGL